MIALLSSCQGLFTDSGGVQKEAYHFKKQCVTLREQTEWVELVEAGINVLTGADPDRILAAETGIHEMLNSAKHNLYGDGHAGEKIIIILSESFE